MIDEWPSVRDLGLTADHIIWRFQLSGNDRIKIFVASPNTPSQAVDLPVAFVPILGCFDLEYWIVMSLIEVDGDILKSLKARTKKKYMQNMRKGVVDEILSATEKQQQDLKWNILHQWSTRTFARFTHSDFGRREYLKNCAKKSIIPYSKTFTSEGKFL